VCVGWLFWSSVDDNYYDKLEKDLVAVSCLCRKVVDALIKEKYSHNGIKLGWKIDGGMKK